MSELKCCKICGAFLTCTRKGECCPECEYFDETDMICLAPDALKKKIKKAKPVVEEEVPTIVEDDDVDPETFLFEDDEEEEEDDVTDDDDFDDEDLEIEEVEW